MLIRPLARSSTTATSPFILIRQYHATYLSSAPTLPNPIPIRISHGLSPPCSTTCVGGLRTDDDSHQLELGDMGQAIPKPSVITKDNITIFINLDRFMSEAIDGAANDWGVKYCCYIIMDIRSPATIRELIMTASISELKKRGRFYAGVVLMAMTRIIGRLIAKLIGWIVQAFRKPSGSEDCQATKDKDNKGNASGTEDSRAIEDKDDKGNATGK